MVVHMKPLWISNIRGIIMAVQPQTPYKEYTANGSTNSFALEFDCENQNHLIVLVDDIEPVVGAWSLIGGAVVFGTAPTNGKKITIQRNTPFRRDEDFQSYDNSFRPPGVNKGFDKIWLKLQELGVADWILSNRIDALKSYVNQQDGILQDNIDSLKNYVDDKDDELRNYLLNAIQEQGVALDQLEEYYSYLMQQLAQVAIDRGWAASFIVSADGSTQQEINDFGGAKWRDKPLGYKLGATVKLMNGDIVKSTVPNNITNPNTDMTGWVNPDLDQLTFNNGIKPRVNFYSITPEMFGAKGDGIADDTNAFRSAVTFASTQKSKIVLNGKYRLTSNISAYTLYGFTSESCGTIIVDHADDVFKFVGASPNTWIERVDFNYKVATTIGKSTFLFEFPYLVMGLKIDRLNLNGFTNCNWTFLKLKGSNGAGFFGGFLYSNVRSHHMYCDVDYDTVPWTNSTTFFNNFKFYGTYGLLVRTGGTLSRANILGWWGQEVSQGVIYCLDGGMAECEIVNILNWDTNVPAITLGTRTRDNTLKAVYVFDFTDYGFKNELEGEQYIPGSETAISASIFKEVAEYSYDSFKALFPNIIRSGNNNIHNGVVSGLTAGYEKNAFWIQTLPATAEPNPVVAAGSVILDSLDPNQLSGFTPSIAKYDRYSSVVVFYDFYLYSADIDDRAFEVGIGLPDNAGNNRAGRFLTNIGGRLKIINVAWDNSVTELFDVGVLTEGRYQLQMRMGNYQSAGLNTIHLNRVYIGEMVDSSVGKRPIVKVKSTTKQTVVGLIKASFKNRTVANFK